MLPVSSSHSPQTPWPHTVQVTHPLSFSHSLEGDLRATSAALGESSWHPWQERGRTGQKRKAAPYEEEEMLEQQARAPRPLGSSHTGFGQHVKAIPFPHLSLPLLLSGAFLNQHPAFE